MPRLYTAVAETSGDRLAAAILAQLGGSGVELRGMCGPALRHLGVACAERAEDAVAMGLAEVVSKLPRLWRLERRLRADLLRWRPDVLLTVDSPGLMLRLGRFARSHGIRVVHAVSPQLWAWRPGRAARIADSVNVLLCLLPFEPALYEDTSLDARFIGHPALASLLEHRVPPTRPPTFAWLPGSRPQEVAALWPAFRSAATELRVLRPDARLVVVRAPGVSPAQLGGIHADVVPHLADVAGASGALVASGTATIELAAMGIPMAVAYRTHPITWALGTRLVRGVRDLALPNVLAGRQIVPEHLQDLHPASIARDLAALLGPAGDRQRAELATVTHMLAPQGAATRAAQIVDEQLRR